MFLQYVAFVLLQLQEQGTERTCCRRVACCVADLVGSVSQRIDVEVIRDSQEGNAVRRKSHTPSWYPHLELRITFTSYV